MKKKYIFIIQFFLIVNCIFANSEYKELIRNLNKTGSSLSSYDEYKNELNSETIDFSKRSEIPFYLEKKYEGGFRPDYCEEIILPELKGKTFAVLAVEGSARIPYLTIYTFSEQKQKYVIYYETEWNNSKYVVPVDYKRKTLFIEFIYIFDNKRLEKKTVWELKNKEWIELDSIYYTYSYELSAEDKKWISSERIEQLVNFDYTFLGYEKDHPNTIEIVAGNKKIVGKLFYTSVGYMSSNYDISIYQNGESVKKIGNQWGFYIVNRENKNYLVYIGMGSEKGEERASSIENFYLQVYDLESDEIIYKNYLKGIINEKK